MNPAMMSTTDKIDTVFILLFGLSGLLLVGITLTMIYFVIRYHRSRNPEPTSTSTGNLWLELIWTIIPGIIVMGIFWVGWDGYLFLSNAPSNSMDVKVTGRMWSWRFEYPEGKGSDKLYVPVGKPVRLAIESADVIHSLYIPAFRVKRDAVPGMTTYIWFRADEAGTYDIFCAEYCGLAHADMITTVEALPAPEFDLWLNKPPEGTHPAVELYENYGCTGCHSIDGTDSLGPSLHGTFGRERHVIVAGMEKEVLFDESYFRRSLDAPNAELVAGFDPVMPSFEGAIPEEEVALMIDFMKSGGKQKPDGKALLGGNGCLGCHSTDGSIIAGPSFKGLAGSTRTVLKDGNREEAVANRPYLKRAIVKPDAEITEGFSPMMPAFDHLTDEEIDAIIDALETMH